MHPDLALALELADAADQISIRWFGAAALETSTKPDLTPVTQADREVESVLRDLIARARPGDAVVGEEMGAAAGGAGATRRWVLDPIDGTKNYVRGVPVWATLVALQSGTDTVAGVVSAPALARRWWAGRGGGAFAEGRRVRVSAVRQLEEASLSYDSVAGFEAAGLAEPFLALARRCRHTRGFGDFWSHMLVAEGAVDVAVEPEVSLWDVAAVQLVVEEAGGRFTDLSGTARPDGGSAVSTNGLLHDEVLAVLAGS